MIVICVFVFCYGKILVVICRQARVVAGHSGPGSSTSQTQLSQIKSIVIKMMILVCAFHIITPGYICYLIVHSTSDLPITLHTSLPCSWDFFLNISANQFIYTTNLHPVRRILVGLVPRKKSQQASERQWYFT